MRRILVYEIAKSEIREAARTYEGHRRGLGAEFREELRAVLEQVREAPLTFRVVRHDIRRANLTRFPYALFFIFRELRTITVIAVTHQRSDSALW